MCFVINRVWDLYDPIDKLLINNLLKIK